MKKVILLTWYIIEYPENSGLFELQGNYKPFDDDYLLKIIPYDFYSFDIRSKIGKSYPDGCQFRNRVTLIHSIS